VDELLAWYRTVRRDLPWRRTVDPYAILVSEVMLQQTQVVRVVPRYEAWLERWPTVEALAAAPLADVLGAWVGLGYNRRAKALWEAAGVVAERGWPEDLRELPGVGPYTAAAVGSFAFDRPELAIDTNARRVFARWGFVPAAGSAELNQAVMELGATVCRAHEARCDACPIERCGARGLPVARPPRRPRVRFEETDRYARGRVLAALAGRERWPDGLGETRIERALAALERDGMVVREGARARLP
jgi:A/G-specific adenine glycosylase